MKIAHKSEPKKILQLAAMQCIVTLVFCIVLYFALDTRNAISAALGGIIAVLGTIYMAMRLRKATVYKQANLMLSHFYASEIVKLVLTIAMMAVCIAVLQVAMLAFIVAYILAALIINWLFLYWEQRD